MATGNDTSALTSSAGITLKIVDQEGLLPYIEGLRALERSILYPVDDGADHFFIDHGPTYHAFFSGMGKARFLLVLHGKEVIGSLAGVWRKARFGNKERQGLYFCDLKLAKAWRGQKLVHRMLWYALARWPVTRDLQGWRFVYFAAMQGPGRDLSRSFRGWHLGKLVRPISIQSLYFVPATQLAGLNAGGPPPPKTPGLDYSLCEPQSSFVVSTEGRKDLRLQSTGQPWSLVHLPHGPAQWPEDFGLYLQGCGQEIQDKYPQALACFGLDQRLTHHIEWLQTQGIERGAQCMIYGFSIPGFAPMMGQFSWAHLACSEI